MKWYVIQVLTGKEEGIKKRICEQGVKAIVPTRIMMERTKGKWKKAERTVFPSYVFVYTEMDSDTYYKIKPLPGVIRFLGGDRGPVPIRDDEVNLVLELTRDGDPLGLSQVYKEGSKIVIVSGPLVGLEGKIMKLDARRFRAKVNISLMGEPRIVELAIEVIKKSED